MVHSETLWSYSRRRFDVGGDFGDWHSGYIYTDDSKTLHISLNSRKRPWLYLFVEIFQFTEELDRFGRFSIALETCIYEDCVCGIFWLLRVEIPLTLLALFIGGLFSAVKLLQRGVWFLLFLYLSTAVFQGY